MSAMNPVERLAEWASVTISEFEHGTNASLLDDTGPFVVRVWWVTAAWEGYQGSRLIIEREGATILEAVEAIEARKREFDAEMSAS